MPWLFWLCWSGGLAVLVVLKLSDRGVTSSWGKPESKERLLRGVWISCLKIYAKIYIHSYRQKLHSDEANINSRNPINSTWISGFPGMNPPFLRGIGLGDTRRRWLPLFWCKLLPFAWGIPTLLPLVVVVGDTVLLPLSTSHLLPGGGGRSSTPSMSEPLPWLVICGLQEGEFELQLFVAFILS